MNENLVIPNGESDEDEIDIGALLQVILHRWWLVLLWTVLFGAVALAGTITLVKPTYRATFTAYINNTKNNTASETLTSQDITASRSLTSTYAAIITSQPNIENAIKDAGVNITYEDIADGISVGSVDDTEIIKVNVITEDPQMSYELAHSLENVSPDYGASIVEGSSMMIITPASVPKTKYSPSYSKALMIGAALGFVMMCAILVIMELMDNRVKDAGDLERYGIVVIGNIHDLSASSNKKGYYGYYGYGKSKRKRGKK